jgi:exoribonuclease R
MTTRSGPRRTGEGGWNAIVAIADVSFYRPSRFRARREARARGNSVYFPDRVVPMLPENCRGHLLAEGRRGRARRWPAT